ncbi:MAG: GNAT family N-acetyltransferase [Chloroflexi bacterium]|nr:GNAT family N-acetyltransferase [Chloroflexota bacterium]
MFPEVKLIPATRDDVQRVADWLDDTEVNSMWYGLGEDGLPLHIGYSPHRILQAPEEELQTIFDHEDRKIYSVYTQEDEHIGEGQLVIEWPLQEAQLFLLIGRKDLWHHHYGTMALIQLLDQAYETHGLHRVWVDIPEYNEHALQMFRDLGFVLEGHFRKAHRKDGEWYDSSAMGLLADEYTRRRSRLMGTTTG